MNISELLISSFKEKINTNLVFVYPGGTIAPLANACSKFGINVEVFKTEQGAGFAAIGASIASLKPSLCFVTSGPGVTNILTCIADAYYDSIPVVFLTGQVGTSDLERNPKLRQRGFQETPTLKLCEPISKKVFTLRKNMKPKEIIDLVDLSISIANTDRKGPVIIDCPMDAQLAEVISIKENNSTIQTEIISEKVDCDLQDKNIDYDYVVALLKSSERPAFLIGGGVNQSLSKKLGDFVQLYCPNIALTYSLRGLSYSSTDHYSYCGYIGHTGNVLANKIIDESDLLIAIGTRLDIRQTGSEFENFSKNKKLILVNNDFDEVSSQRVNVDNAFIVDSYKFVKELEEAFSIRKQNISKNFWFKKFKKESILLEDPDLNNVEGINPSFAIRHLLNEFNNIAQGKIISTGVGSHQHWTMRNLKFNFEKDILLTSSGHGTMGYDIPAIIGAAMIANDKIPICVCGDGSFLMNGFEIIKAIELNINLKLILIKNNSLGIVSTFQNWKFGNRIMTSNFNSADPKAILLGMGMNSVNICKNKEDLMIYSNEFIFNDKASAIIIECSSEYSVNPMVMVGDNLSNPTFF